MLPKGHEELLEALRKLWDRSLYIFRFLSASIVVTGFWASEQLELEMVSFSELLLESGKRRWLVIAVALFVVLLLGLAAKAFLLSDTEDSVESSRVEGYPSLEEVVRQVMEVEQNFGNLVTVEVIGRSLEGRPIHSVSVVTGNQRDGPLVWLICGLHAREWVSPLACIHILQSLAKVR